MLRQQRTGSIGTHVSRYNNRRCMMAQHGAVLAGIGRRSEDTQLHLLAVQLLAVVVRGAADSCTW
jgi:hypothetical protein